MELRAEVTTRLRADRIGAVTWHLKNTCVLKLRNVDLRRLLAQVGISAAEQKVAERLQRLLLEELPRRVKNTLATVMAITSKRRGGVHARRPCWLLTEETLGEGLSGTISSCRYGRPSCRHRSPSRLRLPFHRSEPSHGTDPSPF